jgi:small subunit ribosomal protein S21
MPEVEIKKGESVDRALKRLKNKLEAEGIMDEMRRLRAFETPIQRYRRKQRTAAKKTRMRFRANLQVFRRDNSKKIEAAAAAAAAAAGEAPAAAPATNGSSE